MVVENSAGVDITGSCDVEWRGGESSTSGFKLTSRLDLAGGDSFTVKYDMVAGVTASRFLQQSGADNAATGGAANSNSGSGSNHTVTFYTPELTVSKTASKTASAGDPIDYTVEISQVAEGAAAYNISLADNLDPDSVLAGAYISVASLKTSKSGTAFEPLSVQWTKTSDDASDKASGYVMATGEDLAYGEKITITYTAYAGDEDTTALNGTSIGNDVHVWSDNSDEAEDGSETTVAEPEIDVIKESSSDSTSVSGKVHYTITATETVPDAVARNVEVADAISWTGDADLIDSTAVLSSLEVHDKNGRDIPFSAGATYSDDGDGHELLVTISTEYDCIYGDSVVVEYDVRFGDGKTASTGQQEIENVAQARGSNTTGLFEGKKAVELLDAALDVSKNGVADEGARKIAYEVVAKQPTDAIITGAVLYDFIADEAVSVGAKFSEDMRIIVDGEDAGDDGLLWLRGEDGSAVGYIYRVPDEMDGWKEIKLAYSVDMSGVGRYDGIDVQNVAFASANNAGSGSATCMVRYDTGHDVNIVMIPATQDNYGMMIMVVIAGTGAAIAAVWFSGKRRVIRIR